MMQNLHKEIVLDHYRRPRNKGEIPGADLEEHLLNPLCGDEVTVYARVENGRVAEVRFAGRGCAISQASASMLTGRLAGKSLAEAEKEIEAFLEMMRTKENGENGELGELAALRAVITAPNRIRCATLAWTAFQQGLQSSLPKG
jgi:nitrogen fixation NifU-like protein